MPVWLEVQFDDKHFWCDLVGMKHEMTLSIPVMSSIYTSPSMHFQTLQAFLRM